MMVQITLVSGAQIEFELDDLETSRDKFTGNITKMNWTTPQGWVRKLHTINIDHIAAIVCIRDPAPVTEDRPSE